LSLSRSRKTSRKKSSSTFVSRRTSSSSFTTSNVSSTSRSLFASSSSLTFFSISFAALKSSTTLKTSSTSSSFRFYFFVTTKNARVSRLTRELLLICQRFVNIFDDIDDIFAFSLSDLKSFFFWFKFILFEFDFTSICKALILQSICDAFAIHSSRKIIRSASRLRNKMNKKIINLILRVENESLVFFNLNAHCEWMHTRLKNTNDSTIDRIFCH
jgi:hypothetical protein